MEPGDLTLNLCDVTPGLLLDGAVLSCHWKWSCGLECGVNSPSLALAQNRSVSAFPSFPPTPCVVTRRLGREGVCTIAT